VISAELAEHIAIRFGLGADPVLSTAPVARGEQGLLWRLDTRRGSFAVKEAFRAISVDDVRTAAGFAAAARALGINTPQAIPDTSGQLVADLGPVEIRVHEWIDLLPVDLRLDPVALGKTVAGIHRTDFASSAPLDDWFTAPLGEKRWDALGVELASAGAPFVEQFAAVREELSALEAWVRPPVTVRTCHRDLWGDNLRPAAAGGLCVIDWDDCGPADPSYELGCVLFEFGAGEAARIGEIYESYLRSGGPGRVRQPADFSMLICQLGHICEIACRDWLDPAARSTDRQHNAERFAEFVARPLDRAGLQTILDGVGGVPAH
jgi:Ser/Thr protein kinase RdoA (MazF antagonist)